MHTHRIVANEAKPIERPGPDDRPPRRLMLRALARHGHPSASSALSVSKLGSRRWHIRISGPGEREQREIYLSPQDGGLLYTTFAGRRLDIRFEGDLGEGSTRNLGDCLVRAITDDARHIVLWLDSAPAGPPEATGVLECFGRELARERVWRVVEIRGDGTAARELAGAFERGIARMDARHGAP